MLSGLVGRRILVTRPRAQGHELETALASLGAHPISFPTIDIRPAQDPAPLDRALDALDRYAWIAFTSVNSVASFFDRLSQRAGTIPPGVRIAAVGPGTARALTARGARVDFVPSEFLGERLGQELMDVDGQRVLFPRAAGAREALALELTRRGAAVEDVIVYETLPAALDPLGLAELEQGVDAATFTSASTVDNLFLLLGGRAARLLEGVVIACIGPVTADAARANGLVVHIQPVVHTVSGLVSALVERFA